MTNKTDGFIRIKESKFPKVLPTNDCLLDFRTITEKIIRKDVERKEKEAIERMKDNDLIKAIDYTKELLVPEIQVILCNRRMRNIIIKSDIDLAFVLIVVSDCIEDGTLYVVTDQKIKEDFIKFTDIKLSNPWFIGGVTSNEKRWI